MQLLWIGCLESDEEFINKAKKGYDLASAQVSQKNILIGLEKCIGQNFDSINGCILPGYPIYADKIVDEVIWQHKPECFDISVGYKNIKYLNRLTCRSSMLKAADKWITERYKGDDVIMFVYSMRSAPMATACYIKKKIKNCKIYLITTDLPQFMDLGQNKFKTILKKIDWINIKGMQEQFDGFILYASKMADFLKIPNGKWMLMEGSYDAQKNKCHLEFEKKKAIMYSGKLDMQYGMKLLLDAFMGIEDSETELWITGGGNAENYIKICAMKDSRIKFFGFLPSYDDVLRKQREASVLINMRLPSEEASKYCFPSKLFEYMATGTPVLSFRLGGIPDEYYSYLHLIEEESVEGVKNAIEECINLHNDTKGKFACEFIMKKKTMEYQANRIVEFIGMYDKGK